jgi:glycerol-3-phosphate dehydrogenase (NAD(P)+)
MHLSKKNIVIFGSGGWGIAIAILLNHNGHNVKVWSYSSKEAELINSKHTNTQYLPDVIIPDDILFFSGANDINLFVTNADYLIIAVPSVFVKDTLNTITSNVNQTILEKKFIISASKGLYNKKRISQVIAEAIPCRNIIVLSGPTHAEEVSKFMPTACVIGSEDDNALQNTEKLFSNNFFFVKKSDDVIGIEIGGALKNIIALAIGIAEGLNFSDNIKSAIITKSLEEIYVFAKKFGAREETIYGLSGLGDLIVTCMSKHSRNHQAGILLGKGFDMERTKNSIGKTIESFNCLNDVINISNEHNINLSLFKSVYEVVYNNEDPRSIIYKVT